MRYLTVIFGTCFILLSCTKDAASPKVTPQGILMGHKWSHFQTRELIVDTLTNAVIKDSLYQAEICYQNSLFVFAADSVVKRTVQCFTPATNIEGRWYLKSDSTFAAPIIVRSGYGTGTVYTDFGLPFGKMITLSDTEFKIISSSPGLGNNMKYYTYYLKAQY